MITRADPARLCVDPAQPRLDPAALFRSVFAQLPCGVSVVTTLTPHGPRGLTASSVCSVSLDPLLLLVCINNRSQTLSALLESDRFAVNILRREQTDLSARFAAAHCADRFQGLGHEVVDEAPVLSDALAWLTCRVEQALPGGDHTVVIGRVTSLRGSAGGEPLVWHAGRYRALAPLGEEPSPRTS
jgi:flavin reductase (DIM6/NTAB) family NADH-FMN oxidoreductase RutF